MSELDVRLLAVSKKIEEVRAVLNELCVNSKDLGDTLLISQCLDELIVEYYKLIKEKKDNLTV